MLLLHPILIFVIEGEGKKDKVTLSLTFSSVNTIFLVSVSFEESISSLRAFVYLLLSNRWQYTLEYSKSIRDLLGNARPPRLLIEDPKTFLKVIFSSLHLL